MQRPSSHAHIALELRETDTAHKWAFIKRGSASSDSNALVISRYNADAGAWDGWVILDVQNTQIRVKKSVVPDADNAIDLGSSSNRWKDGHFAGTVYTGDVEFKNKWRITEYDEDGNVMEDGLRILNSKGEEIFRITEDGLWFKGKKIA